MNEPHNFGEYLCYIKDTYPNSPWIQYESDNYSLKKLYSCIYDSLLINEVFSDNCNLKGHSRFLNDFHNYFQSILIAFPVNHQGFISYLIRTSTESFLKYIFSICYTDFSEEEVARTGFRHLKKDLKDFFKGQSTHNEIVQLLKIYGEFSKNIHAHVTEYFNSQGTLDYYSNNISTFFLEIIDVCDELIKLTVKIKCVLANFNFEDLNHSTRVRLSRRIDKERLSLLVENKVIKS